MCVNDPRARTRAALIVQDLEPFAIIQLAQRIDGDALETPHVFFRTMTERRVFEGHSKALGSGFILERFSFECGAQWRGETAPAAIGQLREVAFKRGFGDNGRHSVLDGGARNVLAAV